MMRPIGCPEGRYGIAVLTYSMEQSSSCEANSFSANKEILRILWNSKIHYRIHKSPPPLYPKPARSSSYPPPPFPAS
jgi:hypothetical protein